uniref:Uncharacterized protein n=1 Tax=Lepeophtheirus salmonis TaxID=72036 RepID=A0A0K2UUX7_LEPSM
MKKLMALILSLGRLSQNYRPGGAIERYRNRHFDTTNCGYNKCNRELMEYIYNMTTYV